METAHSPLLPQIKRILGRMGYAPVSGDAALFMNKNSLNGVFYRVSAQGVQKSGVMPLQEPVSHIRFVTDHVRYLFP